MTVFKTLLADEQLQGHTTLYVCNSCTVILWYSVCASLSLQSDCQIHLQSQVAPDHMDEYLSSIHVHQQTSSQLNKFRMYMSVARLLDYSISDEMTKVRHTVINSVLIVHKLNSCVIMRPLHQLLPDQITVPFLDSAGQFVCFNTVCYCLCALECPFKCFVLF